MLALFADRLRALERRAPRIQILSTVTGTWLTDEEACGITHWIRHLREPVRYADAVARSASSSSRR